MGFVVTVQEDKPEELPVKGKRYRVAVGSWSTSAGCLTPKIIRYQDDEGVIRTVRIHVESRDQKCYAGVQLQCFGCWTVIYGMRREFILLYHPLEGTWDMVLPEQ